MELKDILLGLLLFSIGLAFVTFIHLIIPISVAKSKKTFTKKSTLWLIASAGGLLGFIICAIMVAVFRGPTGIIQSAFWTIINYFILKKKCYEKKKED